MKLLLTFFYSCSLVTFLSLEFGHASTAIESYLSEKEKVVAVDQQSRHVMSKIYEINQRMKGMSRKRNILNDRIISADGNVRILARETVFLEDKIKQQRATLSKRLKAIYMLGDEGVVRVIFSSASAQDLDESLKYLKLISDHDYKTIKSYQKNLLQLNSKKILLKKEVKSLITLKNKLQNQEELLGADQSIKSEILKNLKDERAHSLAKLNKLRELAVDKNESNLFDISFCEKKGQLQPPTSGGLLQDFGLVEDPEFQYRLSHKGHRYKAGIGTAVRSIYGGVVSFIGQIEGYGKTIVIDHGDHYYSVYANIESVKVSEGEVLREPTEIAKNSGELYFEIRHFSDAIDPKQWLTGI